MRERIQVGGQPLSEEAFADAVEQVWPIVEAMATGLPVVTTRVGGMTELLPPSVGCIVEPPTPQRFADTIGALLQDLRGADAMGERARRSLFGRFDQASVAKQLEDLYFSIVRKS
ncbi:MAG: glycosyltransferase [Gemmatimonadetes bacterium]|nr:glycosyltransferase [Gemmatimonadota bacterium]